MKTPQTGVVEFGYLEPGQTDGFPKQVQRYRHLWLFETRAAIAPEIVSHLR